jgi:hypothetical protein
MCTTKVMKALFNEDMGESVPVGCVVCNSTKDLHMVELGQCNYIVLCGSHGKKDLSTYVNPIPLMHVEELANG